MKRFLFLLIYLLSFQVLACGVFFLSQEIENPIEQIKQAKKTIKEAKTNIKSIKKIKAFNDFTDQEFKELQRFSNYLNGLPKKDQLKKAVNILSNFEIGKIKNAQKSLKQAQAYLVYSKLSVKKQSKVQSIMNSSSTRKKSYKKLEKIIGKKKAKTISQATFPKRLCCLKKCKKCPVNFHNFKLEQQAKKKKLD